jgi:hypothetical protein
MSMSGQTVGPAKLPQGLADVEVGAGVRLAAAVGVGKLVGKYVEVGPTGMKGVAVAVEPAGATTIGVEAETAIGVGAEKPVSWQLARKSASVRESNVIRFSITESINLAFLQVIDYRRKKLLLSSIVIAKSWRYI